jgi:class I fructose-bisphosphate aldolase
MTHHDHATLMEAPETGTQPGGRVEEILSYYPSDSAGTKANLRRLFTQGRLAGTGRLVILPVDQGFEHGPHRSFAVNPPAYDPEYHPRFALAAGMSGYAAPLGFIEAIAGNFSGHLPLILKVNNHDLLYDEGDPLPAVTGSVEAAIRLGCVAIGYTIYPGSAHCNDMYEKLQFLAEEAKSAGLAVVVWSYPRGSGIPDSKGETALDVVAYAAQLACQMGAHVVKVKLPTEFLYQDKAKKIYEDLEIPRRPGAPHPPGRLRRQADRDLLGGLEDERGRLLRRHPRDPGRRRLRLDHRPQHVPAAVGRVPGVHRHGDRHLSRGGVDFLRILIAGRSGEPPEERKGVRK